MSYFRHPRREVAHAGTAPNPASWRKASLAPVRPRAQAREIAAALGEKAGDFGTRKPVNRTAGTKGPVGPRAADPPALGPPRGLGTAAAGTKDREATQTLSQEPGPRRGGASSLFYTFLFVLTLRVKCF